MNRLPLGTMIEIRGWGEPQEESPFLIVTDYIEYDHYGEQRVDVILYDLKRIKYERKFESALQHWINEGDVKIIHLPEDSNV